MRDDRRPDEGIPDATDLMTQGRASEEQAAERERLEEATNRLRDDPGDPKDRLSDPAADRLFQQTTQREARG